MNKRRARLLACFVGAPLVWAVGSACLLPSFDDLSGGLDADGSASDQATGDRVTLPPPLPSCGGGYCRVTPPSGWEGPGTLSGGELVVSDAAAPDAESCSTGPFSIPSFTGVGEGLTASPATCTCSCGPSNLKCWVVDQSYYGAACASGGSGVYGSEWPINGCATSLSGIKSIKILDASPTTDATAACPPSTKTVRPVATWGRWGSFCTGSFFADTCGAGSLCVPSPEPLCIAHAGDVPCPSTTYVDRHVLRPSATDTRTCEGCSCTPPANGCAGVSPAPCGGGARFPEAGPGCFVNAGSFNYYAGDCTPTGGTATGSVAATGNAVTMCCEKF